MTCDESCLTLKFRRSSDSAKYTNKSSGTSVLSGNINTSSFHPKFYAGGKNDRQSHGSINTSTAPVHKKFVANPPTSDNNNHIITRFINNNINNNSQSYNHHYSLSLNRHAENHNANLGVGCIGTLTSPYAGNGVEGVRGTKSDIGGIALEQPRRMHRNGHKSSILHKSTLSSVHSDMSIYEATFKDSFDVANDLINNNTSTRTPLTSAITFSKTGSKLLYTNKHRLSTLHSKMASAPGTSANPHGPLLYTNSGNATNANWKHSIYDNPIRSVSSKRKHFSSSREFMNGNRKPHEAEPFWPTFISRAITAIRRIYYC